GVRFNGVEDALPGPKVIDTILNASLVIVAPSNPIVSIGPILAIPEITEALKAKKENVVAISGIIGGKALKGPADRLLLDLGHEVSSVGVARIYSDLVSNFVIDDTDALLAAQIEDLGMRCLTTDTVMSNPQKSAKLCSALLSFCFPEAPV
ncbi:MAG: 2-phospho-L-lactate transferase CofD family protein, partial [Actinomycetota bacterium]|nr:2-phospho-L-lactate transferase CofD family protein [Actinomycetota bacterium]